MTTTPHSAACAPRLLPPVPIDTVAARLYLRLPYWQAKALEPILRAQYAAHLAAVAAIVASHHSDELEALGVTR